ncbi:MAG: saccharopine dehydrogenase NADP-binding domain-containing protein [Actinomycetota bacterium]|nr:saccharopine dehydrogenase NADP-binding domain-containing protein [Actinomycetota bacterium]
MRVLVVGAGGVGAAIARAAAESDVLERVVVADLDLARASAAVDRCADTRFVAHAAEILDRT